MIENHQKKQKTKASALCKTPPKLIKGRNSSKEFHCGNFLGEGGFAKCFQVEDMKGNICAAKTIAKSSLSSQKSRTKLLGEIKVHKCMDHPNIVKFIDCFEDDINVYIILEICSNGTLMDMIKLRKRLQEPEVRFFLIQILGAVKYMHSRKVIHRDLKLGNVMLDSQMNVKIGDFGLAALLMSEKDRKKTICGTPNYIAPEVLFGNNEGHSFEVDLWSVGIIMYAMLYGKPPFQSKEVNHIYEKIKSNTYDFPTNIYTSDSAKSLVKSLLNPNPKCRPSIDQVLNHSFFNGPMPLSLSISSRTEVVDYFDIPTEVSRENIYKVASSAGLTPPKVPQDIPPLSGAGKPLTINDIKIEPESKHKLLPETLSPKMTKQKYRPISSGLPNKPLLQLSNKTTKEKELLVEKNSTLSSSSSLSSKSSKLLNKNSLLSRTNLNDHNTIKRNPSKEMEKVKLFVNCETINPYVENSSQENIRNSIKAVLTGLDDSLFNSPFQLDANLHSLKDALFVSTWVDYSNKYGLGYQLSNKSSGVLFNDDTTLIISPDSKFLEYITKSDDSSNMNRKRYPEDRYSADLQKKVYLAKHFSKYMDENLLNNNTTNKENEIYDDFETGLPFMTHYKRGKQCIMFRISTGEIQFNFADHYKMLISADGLCMRFVTSNHEIFYWSITDALCCDKSSEYHIKSRIDYAITQLYSWESRLREQ